MKDLEDLIETVEVFISENGGERVLTAGNLLELLRRTDEMQDKQQEEDDLLECYFDEI